MEYLRRFLQEFNQLVVNTLKEVSLNQSYISKKGTIKRTNIPQWVKNAVFHRDKGRCVFCNVDLTRLINIMTTNNYDHIVPLDLFGVNDPCNIQLSCESCNKIKSNKRSETGNQYSPWWPK